MCCNYCYYFEECRKSRKTDPNCCKDCAEYEFCPFILGETDANDLDSPTIEGSSDIDIFGSDEF